MSDAPNTSPPETSPVSPTRPWTILGRLSDAVREQNWSAVALEVFIVVLGVVIGFQVTGWGQARTDRAQEQVYLRQLADDLRETEATMRRTDAFAGQQERAAGLLVESFDASVPPPSDSVYSWLGLATWIEVPRAVLGTAEALVASGDLGLIQDDSLRSAITTYLEMNRADLEQQTEVVVAANRAFEQASLVLDSRSGLSHLPPNRRQMLQGLGHPRLDAAMFPPSDGSWTPPFPGDVEAFYRNREAYGIAFNLAIWQHNLAYHRRAMRELAQGLRERIEAELNR